MDGNDQRFQQIYEDFHARILRYMARMVGERDAEDLAQDVFIKLRLSIDTFRGDSSLKTWMYRIATNTALDWLRRSSSRRAGGACSEPAFAGEDGAGYCRTGIAEGEQRFIRQEMNGCIRSVIDTLPGAYRSAIILSDLEDLKDSEIAEVLQVSLQAAKIKLHRARARLRKELEKTCDLYRDGEGELACDRKQKPVIIRPSMKE